MPTVPFFLTASAGTRGGQHPRLLIQGRCQRLVRRPPRLRQHHPGPLLRIGRSHCKGQAAAGGWVRLWRPPVRPQQQLHLLAPPSHMCVLHSVLCPSRCCGGRIRRFCLPTCTRGSAPAHSTTCTLSQAQHASTDSAKRSTHLAGCLLPHAPRLGCTAGLPESPGPRGSGSHSRLPAGKHHHHRQRPCAHCCSGACVERGS